MLKNVSLILRTCPRTHYEIIPGQDFLSNCMTCPDSVHLMNARGERFWVCNYADLKTGKPYRKDGTDK
jgi:hypothetical protein